MVGWNENAATVPAGTSVIPRLGCRMRTGLPHAVQKCRWLASVFLKTASLSAPLTTFTFRVGQSVAAWSGEPSQPRHELQWQYACAAGSPLIATWTAPQKQPLLYEVSGIDRLLPGIEPLHGSGFALGWKASPLSGH